MFMTMLFVRLCWIIMLQILKNVLAVIKWLLQNKNIWTFSSVKLNRSKTRTLLHVPPDEALILSVLRPRISLRRSRSRWCQLGFEWNYKQKWIKSFEDAFDLVKIVSISKNRTGFFLRKGRPKTSRVRGPKSLLTTFRTWGLRGAGSAYSN